MKPSSNKKADGAPTVGKALLVKISILAAVMIAVVVSAGVYLSIVDAQSQAVADARSRLEGYHELMAFMVEDVDHDGAERLAAVMARDAELSAFRVVNRFQEVIVEHDHPDFAAEDWISISLDILDRQGFLLAIADYHIRKPAIDAAAYARILAISLGAALICGTMVFLIFTRLRGHLVAPIRTLHRSVRMLEEGDLRTMPPVQGPREIAELSRAIGDAFQKADETAAQSARNVDILTEVLSNFGVAIRYLDKTGVPWDYGRVPDGILPRSALDGLHRDRKELVRTLQTVLATAFDSVDIDEERELPEHALLQIECSAPGATFEITLFDVGDAEHAIAVADVSRARAMEASALESQKMEAVGQLASGIAHDFNNLLGVVVGNTQLLELKNKNESLQQYIEAIVVACDLGASLTNKLLSFARRSPLKVQIVDLNKAVNTMTSWSSRVLPENIETEVVLHNGIWPVSADSAMTESALLNLLLNARDAMPEGGRLTVETANVTIDEDYLKSRAETIKAGRYAMLAVTDTGTGISKDNIKNIFNPFFTTKATGQGSGVGLSMVQGFIRQTGGAIRVYSEEGVGTTIKLFFPARSELSMVRPQKRSHQINETSVAHVLLVEDEAALRDALLEHLVMAGYSVSTAPNGDEALKIFNELGSIDVIVTDIVMPGELSGIDFVKHLREFMPNVPAVFMSGYAQEATVHGNGLHPNDIRLTKPIKRNDLINSIETALQRSASDKAGKRPTSDE